MELSPRYRRVPIRDGATPRWLQFGATSFSEAVHIIYEKYPEVHEKITDFKFPGCGQRKTAVTDARGIVEVIMLLPGRHATRVRRQGTLFFLDSTVGGFLILPFF